MNRIKVCRWEVGPGIRVWGVDNGIFVPIGTYAEAWVWAERLVEMRADAERARERLTRGTGDWILFRRTRRGMVYRRAEQFRSRPWTNDPLQAYGFGRPSEAIEWASRLSTSTDSTLGVIHRMKEAGR